MAMAVTLRERKKARTRDALVGAAHGLFLGRGFDATTVDEIAAAAEVSRRTFFRYFASKEAVVFPHREERLGHFRSLLAERRPGESALAAVRRACLGLAAGYVRDRGSLQRQLRIVEASPALIAHDRELDRDWEDALARALAGTDGNDDARRRARIQAGAILGTIRAVLREWFQSGCELDLVALGEESFALLENGMAERE